MKDIDLKVKTNKLKSTAKELENCANNYRKIAKAFMDSATDMSGKWSGDDSDAFIKHVKPLADDLSKMEKKFREISSVMEVQANIYDVTKASNISKIRGLKK